MAKCMCSCILLVLQLCSSYATNQLDITIPPTDTVGCLGGLSTFYCRMDRNNITKLLWTVDSELVDDEIKQLRGITTENTKFPNGSEESYLYIQGLTINNEQYIGCEIFASVQPYFLADSGFFTVMAPPSVSNVRTNTSGTNTSVFWVAPGCLPLNYTYLITVLNDFNNGSVTTYSSIDEQIFIYTPLCTLYNISVMVTSSDHNSSAVTISYENPTEVKAISIDSLEIEFSDDYNCYGHLIGIITGNVCFGTITIGIYKTHEVDELLEVSTTTVQNPNYTKTSVQFQQTIGPLDSQLRAFVNLAFCHANSSTDKIQTNNSFTTFHVQDIATTLLSNGTLEFSCLFATNSTAEGCLVVITADTYSCNYTLSRGSGPLLTVLPTGNNTQYTCTIVAYDIINGVVGEYYSVVDEILVAFNFTKTSLNTIQEMSVVKTTQTNDVTEVWLLSVSLITQAQLSKSSDNPLMSPINTNIETEEETNLPSSSVIIYATIVPVIVCVAAIFIVLCVVIVLVRRVQAKKKTGLFTMYNANIEKVQANPAYSTVHMSSGRPVIDEVNSIYENPSYASLKQIQIKPSN